MKFFFHLILLYFNSFMCKNAFPCYFEIKHQTSQFLVIGLPSILVASDSHTVLFASRLYKFKDERSKAA